MSERPKFGITIEVPRRDLAEWQRAAASCGVSLYVVPAKPGDRVPRLPPERLCE